MTGPVHLGRYRRQRGPEENIPFRRQSSQWLIQGCRHSLAILNLRLIASGVQGGGVDPFVAQLARLCTTHRTRAKWVFVPTHSLGRTLGERNRARGLPTGSTSAS